MWFVRNPQIRLHPRSPEDTHSAITPAALDLHPASPVRAHCLNTRALLVPLIPGDERGFLGVAFHPTFATSGLLQGDNSLHVQPLHQTLA